MVKGIFIVLILIILSIIYSVFRQKRKKKKFKVRRVIRTFVVVFLLFIVYLVIGGIAPFLIHNNITKDTEKKVENTNFYSDKKGVDRAVIIEDNEEALKMRLKLIKEAKNNIVMSTFDFRSDEAGKDMLSALLDAASRGVKVEIFADGFNSELRMERNNYFYALSCNPNIKIIIYNKINLLTPWKGLGRMHDKYLISDNKAYMLGGRNTFGYFLGNYKGHKNYDRDVLVYNTEYKKEKSDSSIYQIKKYYKDITSLKCCSVFHNSTKIAKKKKVKEAGDYLKERYTRLSEKYDKFLSSEYNYEKNTYETNKITLISNPTTIYSKEPVVFYTLMKLAENAKSEVKIHTPYIICDDYMYEGLSKIGDKTTIMFNSAENNGNLFGAIDYMSNKEKIIDTKMTIKEYEGGISYHGKSMTIDDDMAIVGSFNMDMRSAYIDTELMLAINSREVTKQLKNNMLLYEEKAATVKNLSEYKDLPKGMKMKEISGKKENLHKYLGWIFNALRFLF